MRSMCLETWSNGGENLAHARKIPNNDSGVEEIVNSAVATCKCYEDHSQVLEAAGAHSCTGQAVILPCRGAGAS
jgi:hypothetical protein